MCWGASSGMGMKQSIKKSQGVMLPKPDRALRDWSEYVRRFDEERRSSGAPEITQEEIAHEIKAARAERRTGLAPSPSGRGLG